MFWSVLEGNTWTSLYVLDTDVFPKYSTPPTPSVASLIHNSWMLWSSLLLTYGGLLKFSPSSPIPTLHLPFLPFLFTQREKESEVTQSCPTLCDPMDCSLPGSSIHGIFQTRKYWSGLPFPSPGDLPNPGINPGSPTLCRQMLYHLSHQGSPYSERSILFISKLVLLTWSYLLLRLIYTPLSPPRSHPWISLSAFPQSATCWGHDHFPHKRR